MSYGTKIEWAHHTFNPWIGCSKVGPGCENCYAEADFDKRRHVVAWGTGQPRKRTSKSNWAQPLKWNLEAERLNVRYRAFCASLADVFDNEVPTDWRRDLYALIQATPHLDWLLLTKRIGNARGMLNECSFGRWNEAPLPNVWLGITVTNQAEAVRDIPKLLAIPATVRFLSIEPLLGPIDLRKWLDPWTCSDCGHHGSEFDTGPYMCADCEIEVEYAPEIGSGRCPNCGKDDGTSDDVGGTCPRCGSIRGWDRDYGFIFDTERPAMLDWVIVGGESGPKARPMHPQWARDLRDQCATAGVPFLFKQWGEFAPGENVILRNGFVQGATWFGGRWIFGSEDLTRSDGHIDDEPDLYRIGKKASGRLLEGVEHNGYPEVHL